MDSGVSGVDELLDSFSVEENVLKPVVHPTPEVEGFDISFESSEGGVVIDGEVVEEVFGIELCIRGNGLHKLNKANI